MLDKIVLSSCRKQATMIFTDKEPIVVSSDKDVVPLLMWFLTNSWVYLVAVSDSKTISSIELKKINNDVAVNIKFNAA